MKNTWVRHVGLVLLATSLSAAQGQNASSLKTEYLDDFAETCKHLDQLLQAVPANKYGWRPGAGVRSVSEVYVHIANGNFLLLSVLLKPVDPFFSKHGAGAEIPLKVTGTKSEPHFGLDFGHK
jgi:hypothetical protein